MYDFSILPPHIITSVLSFLKIQDFRNAVLTCKSWYYASCDPKIVRTHRIRIPFDATTIEFLSRPINTLRLDHPNMNKFRYRELLQNFGGTITELDLFVQITMPRLFELFIHLPHVKILKLYDGTKTTSSMNFHRYRKFVKHRDTIRKNIGNIRHLTIQVSTRNLELYKIFLNDCQNIEKFYWYGTGALRRDQSDFLNKYLLNCNESRLLENAVDLEIRSVDTNHNMFESLSNLKINKLQNLSLSEISLSYYDLTFKEFCRTYCDLIKFGMTSCNNQHLQDICRYMKKLKTLEIENCNADSSLCEIKNLPQLECLHLERCDPIVDDSLIQLMKLQMYNLKMLSLNKISSGLLIAIADSCPCLQTLILMWLDTKECEPIFRKLVNLRKLHLGFTESVRCHSSRIISSPVCNITKLTKLEDLYVSCFVPGITPVLVKQLPRVNLDFLEDVFDPTDEDLARWDFNSQELYQAHQHIAQQTDDDNNSSFDLTEFGCILTLFEDADNQSPIL